MDRADVERWFGEYLDTFFACGRGEREPSALLDYYGVPLIYTTDDGLSVVATSGDVTAAATQQTDGLQAEDYSHSEVLSFEVSILNAASALYRGDFARIRQDGSEISRLAATYFITDGSAGRRISAIAVRPL